MQKKSLLVALFCGALCLTGCLKNEESASVALVRGAKAEELKSLAALNNAKAAAEAVYAEAELTVAKAEAELRKAQANLVNAMAETEKVRAELLKVQVALQEVKVDEERVELQKKEAELEKLLAQVEAAKAQAEAEKQQWVNKLENHLAQAEVDAIKNAKRILEAEEKLEEYVLTLEKAHADSAKAAAAKYFAALEDVQDLQKQQLQIKATKALVEAGALTVRDAIHYEMDKIDEEIAEKEAYIAYLKEYQTLTPEEAEEKYQAAAQAAGEAYTALTEKMQAVTEAETAQNTIKNKTADFTQKWNSNFGSNVDRALDIPLVTRRIPAAFGEGENAVSRRVKTTGIMVPSKTEEGKNVFVPFWNNERTFTAWERYPNIDVIANDESDHVHITTTYIAPATINYDNIKVALDTAIAHKEKAAAVAIADAKKAMETSIAFDEEKIAANEELMDLHQRYVDARKEKVTAAENAYIAEVGKAETYKEEKAAAWDAFQEYMLLKYDVSRSLFSARNRADSAYAKAAADTVGPADNLGKLEARIPDLEDKVAAAFEDYNKAIAAYNVFIGTTRNPQEGGDATVHALYEALQTALLAWNPDFDMTADLDELEKINENQDAGTCDFKDAAGQISHPVQSRYFNELDTLEKAEEELYWAQMYMDRNPLGSANYADAKTKYDKAKADFDKADGHVTTAQDAAYGTATADGALQKYQKALAAWEEKTHASAVLAALNPDFVITDIIKYPTITNPDRYEFVGGEDNYEEDEEGNITWIDDEDEVAGTAQAALIVAVKNVVDAQKEVIVPEPNDNDFPEDIDDDSTIGQIYAFYKNEAEEAAAKLQAANKALMVALGADFSKVKPKDEAKFIEDHIADYIDTEAEQLYRAYKDLEDESEIEDARDALVKAYSFNPDEIGELVMLGVYRINPTDNEYRNSRTGMRAQFGWLKSSYKVDYKATMVNRDGKRVPIAEFFYGEEDEPDYTHSLKWQIEQLQKNIDETYPAEFAAEKTAQENSVKNFKNWVARIVEDVNAYKSLEAGYKSWVADRAKAEAAVNEAKKAEFEAKKVKIDAEANYKAACAALNGGVIYEIWDNNRDGIFGYNKVSINETIALLEGDVDAYKTGVSALFTIAVTVQNQIDNVIDGKKVTIDELQSAYEALKNIDKKLPDGSIAELNFTKKVLEETLKAGKVSLQIIIDAFDEQLAVLDEKIEVYTALVNTYKAIMNAYLGIVDETDVEGETGPLDGDGEGDDEE